MIEIKSIEDIHALQECVDIECKLALGRDKNGALPKDFWPTYSAFANTHGGDIFLGLKENKSGSFDVEGIKDTQKVIDELWTAINNPQKASANILNNNQVKAINVDGSKLIQVHVPSATRKQKPIYIKGNPLLGTYRRFNSTDQKLDENSVRRMLAEQVEDSKDNEILEKFGIEDIDLTSLNQYRQLFANSKPDHMWNELDTQGFLYSIGGWRENREANYSGLTRAGLLMFGQLPAIKEVFSNYMLDYQEQAEQQLESRWIDRFTLDGSWSGNVFDFYRKVIRKLYSDLKVPFKLDGDQRQDDTPVHEALREALVNALVHADFFGRAPILIVKRSDMFSFQNPGLMRVPIDMAVLGGESDCRNRLLQDMFRYIGLGDHAGSGLPKIFTRWQKQHWRKPILREKLSPSEQTVLELHMLSLVPPDVLSHLQRSLGQKIFNKLSDNERLILVTAHIEKTVDHSRMMTILNVHPRDLSKLLSSLVDKRLIFQEGAGRGTVYFLPDALIEDRITELNLKKGPEVSSGGMGVSSGGIEKLESIAEPISKKRRAARKDVETTILRLCQERPLKLEELEKLLKRSADVLRKDYLQPLLRTKKLKRQFPTKPNHPQQAYITIGKNL